MIISLPSKVIAPVLAANLPFTKAPVLTVIDAYAMMLPANVVDVPNVAELPTNQYTLDACAPPTSITLLSPDAVVREVPIWKIQTALGSEFASRTNGPVIVRVVATLYIPGSNS